MSTMLFQENVSLQELSSFGVEVSARYFATFDTLETLQEIIQTDLWQNEKHIILGGGTNILFTKDYEGIVLHNEMKGRDCISENDDEIFFRVAAGENWHDFVLFTCRQGYWGIENLALIPGSVGAAPVQNIGAYGVELASVLHSLEAIDLETGERHSFDHDACHFDYRSSIFKQNPGRYMILSVVFRLCKHGRPLLSYDGIQEHLPDIQERDLSPLDLCTAVIALRQSKLPSLGEIGMAGSFFKNPVISKEAYVKLQASYPHIPGYDLGHGMFKIPAAWLITELGYKGIREGNVGTYHRHALVLVNYGSARGEELWNFAKKIMRDVHSHFAIDLEPEVLIV